MEKRRSNLSDEEYELRKLLKLPVTKQLKYLDELSLLQFKEYKVTKVYIIDKYMPSGTYSLLLELEDGDHIRILAPYFAHMQKPSFIEDLRRMIIENDEEI